MRAIEEILIKVHDETIAHLQLKLIKFSVFCVHNCTCMSIANSKSRIKSGFNVM